MTKSRDIADSINRIDSSAADATAVTIDANENVGIGTSSPNISGFTTALTIDSSSDSGIELSRSGTAHAVFGSNANGATITGRGSSGMRFFTSSSGTASERMRIDSSGNVNIGDASGSGDKVFVLGKVRASSGFKIDGGTEIIPSASETMAFKTNSAERMRIDSSGNVGVGTSSLTALAAGYTTLGINGSSGGAIKLEQSGTTRGVLYGNTGGLSLSGQGATNVTFYTNSAERMRILAGGGLTFNGDTAAANALDDYEEGTWTADVGGSASAGSVSWGNTTGYYTKVGDLVHFFWYSGASTVTTAPTGSIGLEGLPYTVANLSFGYSTFHYLHGNLFSQITTGGYPNIGTTLAYFAEQGGTSASLTMNTGSGKYIMVSGTYRAS